MTFRDLNDQFTIIGDAQMMHIHEMSFYENLCNTNIMHTEGDI